MKCLFKIAVLFALAQPAMSADTDPMARLDTNQNRLLEESEAQAALKKIATGVFRLRRSRAGLVGQSRRLQAPMRMGDSIFRNTPLY